MTSKTAGKYRSKKRSEIIANAIGFLLLVVLAAAVLLLILALDNCRSGGFSVPA